MGNHNSSGKARKVHESKKLAKADSGRVEKTCVKGPRKRKRRRRCGQMSDNFIIHGIDYLPESVKRKERRKKHVPKFIFFEDHIWQVNRLNFFARFQNSHSNGGPVDRKLPEKGLKTTDPDPSQVISAMTRSKTACAGFSEEKITDWRTYPHYPFHNIVMSGGGSKGYAYIGSLKALEDCGILKNVSKVAGSSAGAICAGLLAVGCSPQEIADVFKCDIKWLFHDQTCACCCCLPRVCNKFGIHPAKRFHEIYGEHLKKKVGNSDITFLELKESMNRELCIVVTNLSRMCSEYFNHKTTPNLPIRDAVRMSMAFPVVFRAVRYNMSGRECVYTDGGLLDQYPIHCFDDLGSDSNYHSSEDDIDNDELENYDDFEGNGLPNMATLGLYVVSEKPIDHKIWQALFGKEIPCKPTYLPNTKLARERLEKEMAKRKMHNKKFDKQEFMDELCSSVGDGAKDVLDHYEIWNKSHVDIRNFGEYFVATLETLLISQRKLRIKVNDSLRTVAINCGYIGTNDYVIEPGDREFMIDQGYTGTVRYLREFIASRNSSATMRKKKVPRSRSSNLAEQYRIRDELIREPIPKSTDAHGDGNPLARYFLLEDDSDGGNDKPAGENVCPTDPYDLDDQQNLREIGEKPSDLKYQRRNSSKNPEIKVSNKMVGEFFLDSLRYSLPVAGLERTCSRESNAISSSVGPSMAHLLGSTDEGETVGKKPFESYPSDRCESNCPLASAILSTSSESEGYEELVRRTLAALDRSELEPVLESKV